ncbi:MAG: carbamoyltransferase C-terminal domain-containing protein [Pirellulaceae bacterium]
MLDTQGANYHTCTDEQELCEIVSDLIADELVVGWFQGRMEFGPRALGSRSILGDARSEKMQATMNLKIKFRESFRPFAPLVLREYADQIFELRPDQESPYMLLVAGLRPELRHALGETYQRAFGIEKLSFRRSDLPAITHVDYSARVQTVDRARNPLLHALLSQFHQQTGCPVMINTSFNVRSEPIVCTPEEAYRCFMMTEMDALALGSHVMLKSEQTQIAQSQRNDHLAQFQLD